MSILTSILGIDGLSTGVSAIATSATEIIKRFIPDPEKQLEAQQELTRMLVESQSSQMQAMKDVMVADATSGSRYTSAARPTVVYWALVMVTALVAASLFGVSEPMLSALIKVPDKLWDMITYGIGAFVLGRSGEKIATTVATAVTRKK